MDSSQALIELNEFMENNNSSSSSSSKENEKRDKYLDLARELKKLCNMRVTDVPIVFGALEQYPKAW